MEDTALPGRLPARHVDRSLRMPLMDVALGSPDHPDSGLVERPRSLDRASVVALVGDGLLTFDLAVACEVFGLDRSDVVQPWYRFSVVSTDPPPLRTSAGFAITGIGALETAKTAGTVVVPGWADLDRLPSPEMTGFLRERHAAGARILSFCTGAFAVAAAGLLDGRRATTHWTYADTFRRRFPKVELDPSLLFVEDDRIYTAAGAAAGIDLSLHVVAQDHGQRVANAIARHIVLPPLRQGGQAPFVQYDLPRDRASLAPLLERLEANLEKDLDLRVIADWGGMSVRTLTRRFREDLGMPPKRWLLTRRIARARELLETTSLPVVAVAARCGFPSAASLRAHFAELFLTTPSEYRNSFRAC